MRPQVPIEVDERTGVWTTDALPMLYVPRHFFMNNHNAVGKALGREKYAALLYEAGHKSAYRWCAQASEGTVQGLEGLKVFEHYLQRLSARGWGKFSFLAASLAGFSVRVDNSAFVLQEEADKAAAEEDKLCAMFAGWFSGAATWVAEKEKGKRLRYKSEEVHCAHGRNENYCLFQVLPENGAAGNGGGEGMSYTHLFTPITLNKITVKNRIVSTAHAEVYAVDGKPQERYIRYYEEKAIGGLGLAICGGSSPVSRDSPAKWWQSINLANDDAIPHLAKLADAMHKHGCKIMIQATHMGRRSTYHGYDWPHLVTPSGIKEPVHRGYAKTIEIYEIKRIIKDFASAVQRVKQAGLDGVEISAAHQHLIDQFWSPRVNKRTDEYGGSLENRLRFGKQVFEAVRERVGSDFCVGMRMSADEFHEDGLSHENQKEIAQAMAETGLIDFISVIGSGADTHNTLANCMPPMALPPAPFLNLATGIKSVVQLPVMHAQGIKDPQQAEKILAAALVDMVGMTRAHIADPHFVEKVRSGRELQIKQCVSANYCIDRQYMGMDVLCVQNAATSREMHLPPYHPKRR